MSLASESYVYEICYVVTVNGLRRNGHQIAL